MMQGLLAWASAEGTSEQDTPNAYDASMESAGMRIKAFEAAWTNLVKALGAPLVDTASSLINHLTDALIYLTKWAVAHPEQVQIIEGIAAGMAALAVVLGTLAVGSAAAGALGVLAGPAGLIALAGGLTALGAAFKGIPPALLTAAMGAAVGGRVAGVPGAIAGAVVGGVAGAAINGAITREGPENHPNIPAPGPIFGPQHMPDPSQAPNNLLHKESYVPEQSRGPRVIQVNSVAYIDGHQMFNWVTTIKTTKPTPRSKVQPATIRECPPPSVALAYERRSQPR